MLTQAGRGRTRSTLIPGNPELMTRIGDLTHLRMREIPMKATMRILGIRQQIPGPLNRTARNPHGLQPSRHFIRSAGRSPRRDPGIEGVLGFLAHLEIIQIQPGPLGGRTQLTHKRLPLLRVFHRDGTPFILTRTAVDPVRREPTIPVPHSSRRIPMRLEIQDLRGQELQAHLELGAINTASLPGPASVIQSRHQGAGCETRGHRIRVGHPGPIGRKVRPARHLIEARHGACVVAIAGHRRNRSRLTHETRTQHDDFRIQRTRHLVADPEIVHRARSKALDIDIRPGDQATGRFHSRRLLEIQVQTEFRGIHVPVEMRTIPTGHTVLEGSHAP